LKKTDSRQTIFTIQAKHGAAGNAIARHAKCQPLPSPHSDMFPAKIVGAADSSHTEKPLPSKRAKILSSNMVYRGKVFGVRHDYVIEPNGIKATRDVITHGGSVVLLPVLPDGRILMVRQYRYSIGDYLLELVAGRMEKGEKPLAAARRELAEETGYRAKHFREMMNVYPSPGCLQEYMIAYTATGLTLGKTNFDFDELIEPKPFKLKTLLDMIHKGKIHDAKSVAGILYYARFIAPKSA
jgi:ADP-ribose pyrophosphatase